MCETLITLIDKLNPKIVSTELADMIKGYLFDN